MTKQLYCYDLETTGTDPLKDRPVQIGLIDTDRVLMNSLCDPCMPIPEEASNVHGITNETVQGHPDYMYALWTFHRLLPPPDQVTLCGFNHSTYDSVMVDACLQNMNLKLLGRYEHLDVLDILYRYEPELESKKLGDAYKSLNGKTLTGAHGAVADCIGTVDLLLPLCLRHKKSPKEFAEELKTPQVYEIMPIGKYTGLPIERVPLSWARWMKNNADRMRPDLQLTVDVILGEE